MSALGDLIVRMTMDTGGYEAGTNRAAYLTAKLERDIEKSMKRVTVQAAALGMVIANAVTRMASVAYDRVRGAIEAADQLNAMSQKTGIAIGKLQELQYAAILTDVPLQSLATGLKILSKNAAEAAGGAKEQSQVFGAFNIQLRDTSGAVKSQMALLEEWAEIFRVLPDGPEKTALAMKVFGKSGEEMIPLLNKGAEGIRLMGDEAKRFGFVVGEEAVKRLADFTDEMDRMRVASTATVQHLASEWIPWVNRMLEQFNDGIRIAGGFWSAVYNFGLSSITSENASAKVKEIGDEIARINRLMASRDPAERYVGKRASGDLEGLNKQLEFAKALQRQGVADLYRGQDLRDPRDRANEAPDRLAASVRSRQLRAALATADTEALARQRKFVDELQQAWERFEEGYRKATVEQAKGLQTTLDANDKLREEIELIGKSKFEILQIEQARIDDTIAKKEALVATMELAGEDRRHVKIVQDEIKALRERQALSERKFDAEVAADAANILAGINEKADRDAADAIKARQEDISRGLTDALMRGFEGGKDAGQNMLDALQNMFKTQAIKIFIEPVLNTATNALADFLMKSVLNGVSSFGAGGGPELLGGPGFDIPALASGGPMAANQPYIVGERGPELVIPSRNSYVVPNNALGGGASITVVQHNTIDSRTDQAAIHQMLEANRARTLSDIRELQRRNDPRLAA